MSKKSILSESSYRELFLWLCGQRRRFRVTGISMLPSLQPGDQILVDTRAYLDNMPQAGDVVVACHPYLPNLELVKRVVWVDSDNSCFLRGDNQAESTDSRVFGLVSPQLIKGRVTSKLP